MTLPCVKFRGDHSYTFSYDVKIFTTKLLLIFSQAPKLGAFTLKACFHENENIIAKTRNIKKHINVEILFLS